MVLVKKASMADPAGGRVLEKGFVIDKIRERCLRENACGKG